MCSLGNTVVVLSCAFWITVDAARKRICDYGACDAHWEIRYLWACAFRNIGVLVLCAVGITVVVVRMNAGNTVVMAGRHVWKR